MYCRALSANSLLVLGLEKATCTTKSGSASRSFMFFKSLSAAAPASGLFWPGNRYLYLLSACKLSTSRGFLGSVGRLYIVIGLSQS